MEREGIVAIDYLNDEEYAISRPCVIKDEDCWRMWFCAGSTYRIGYTESECIKWDRIDSACILDVSNSGWILK